MTGRPRWIQVGQLSLTALEWGSKGQPVVLALHGWLDNAASFLPLADHLRGLQLVALDLPGHGRSDHWPPGHIHHFVDWVPVVIGVAEALAWPRFSLLGHSMGSGISTLVAGAAPERIDRVVLLEGLGPMSTPARDAPKQLADAMRSEAELAAAGNRLFADLETAITARLRDSGLDREAARLLVERGTEVTEGGVRFTHDPRLRSRSRLRLTEDQVRAFLAAVACPVLAVRATAGWPYPRDILAERLDVLRDVTLVEVEGGHHLHMTHPERVAPIIRDFFRIQ